MTVLESWELLSYVVTVVGLPIAICIFISFLRQPPHWQLPPLAILACSIGIRTGARFRDTVTSGSRPILFRMS